MFSTVFTLDRFWIQTLSQGIYFKKIFLIFFLFFQNKKPHFKFINIYVLKQEERRFLN